MRILKIFTELMREGKLADEEPPLFLVDREMGNLSYLSSQETPFQEMDTQQLAEKTAWPRLFVRQAGKRGYDKIYGISGFDLNLPVKDMLKTFGAFEG